MPEAPFYIPATGPATRPRRSLKHDDTFIVLDSHGDIGASAGGPDGLFHGDTRFLSHLELVLDGMQPLLLGSNLRDDNTALTVDLTNPDVYFEDQPGAAEGHAARRAHDFPVARHGLSATRLRNHGDRAGRAAPDAAVRQRLRRPVRGARPAARRAAARRPPGGPPGHRHARATKGSTARVAQTALRFDPPPTELTATRRPIVSIWRPSEATPIFVTHRLRRADHAEAGAASCAVCAHVRAICDASQRCRHASRPRTISSTRCCAGRWPTSTC